MSVIKRMFSFCMGSPVPPLRGLGSGCIVVPTHASVFLSGGPKPHNSISVEVDVELQVEVEMKTETGMDNSIKQAVFSSPGPEGGWVGWGGVGWLLIIIIIIIVIRDI